LTSAHDGKLKNTEGLAKLFCPPGTAKGASAVGEAVAIRHNAKMVITRIM
jgi:hypothetical protein